MKFDEFWSKIRTLDELSLQTLSRQKEFEISYDNRYDIIKIIPSTNQSRAITKDQFYKVWSIAKRATTPFKTIHYHDVTHNSSYIVAIMKYLLTGEKLE